MGLYHELICNCAKIVHPLMERKKLDSNFSSELTDAEKNIILIIQQIYIVTSVAHSQSELSGNQLLGSIMRREGLENKTFTRTYG